jgi:hypothetical protein
MQISQRAFSAGEISPSLHARVDTKLYQTGLKSLRNFIIQQDGGVVNRPGTIYITGLKDQTVEGRLIKFINDDVRYIIEMGSGFLRFIRNHAQIAIPVFPAWATATTYAVGAQVSQSGVNYQCILGHTSSAVSKPGVGGLWTAYWTISTTVAPAAWANATVYEVGDLVLDTGVYYYCILDHTSAAGTDRPGVDAGWQTKWYALTGTVYEVPSPYGTVDLMKVQYVQNNDVITFTCPGKPRYQLTRYEDSFWIMEQVDNGPSIDTPSGVGATGGGTSGTIYYAVTAVKEGTREESLIGIFSDTNIEATEDDPVTVTWDVVQNGVSYNIYKSYDGVTYGWVGSVGGNPEESSDNAWTDTSDLHTSGAGSDFTTSENASAATNLANALPANSKAADGNYNFFFESQLIVPAAASGTFSGTVKVEAQLDGAGPWLEMTAQLVISQLTGPGTKGWSQHELTVNVPDTGYSSIAFRVRPGVITADLAPATSATFEIRATVAPYDKITWVEALGSFIDEGFKPDNTIAPPKAITEFATLDDFPEVIGHFQQRRMYGNTPGGRNRVWGSKIGSSKNFTYSTPLQDDDAILFELSSRTANPIRHLVDLEKLVIFTTANELIAHGNQDGVLVPGALNIKQHSYNGSSRLAPLVVGDRALYIQARGSYVRSIHPDDRQGSMHHNLSLVASHLFRGKTIVDWDYASYPNSIVWCVRNDGTLLGLTYLPQMDSWGWHRHDTQGTFERVCTIPDSTDGIEEDEAYFIVKRTINATTVRYIEYMPTRYYANLQNVPFMDSAIQVTRPGGGWGATVSGLVHLDQASLSAFGPDSGVANTYSIPNSIAASPNNPAYAAITWNASGIINTPAALLGGAVGAVAWFGLPYVSDIETLDIDTNEDGTLKHYPLLLGDIVLHLLDTYRVWVGQPQDVPSTSSISGLQPLETSTDPSLTTGEDVETRKVLPTASWNPHGRILVRQVDPAPTTILMISPQFNDKGIER